MAAFEDAHAAASSGRRACAPAATASALRRRAREPRCKAMKLGAKRARMQRIKMNIGKSPETSSNTRRARTRKRSLGQLALAKRFAQVVEHPTSPQSAPFTLKTVSVLVCFNSLPMLCYNWRRWAGLLVPQCWPRVATVAEMRPAEIICISVQASGAAAT